MPPLWSNPVGLLGTLQLNAPASLTLHAEGATTYELISGKLPDGMAFSPYGTVTGTPTAPGDYSFMVKACNLISTASRSFSLNVA